MLQAFAEPYLRKGAHTFLVALGADLALARTVAYQDPMVDTAERQVVACLAAYPAVCHVY